MSSDNSSRGKSDGPVKAAPARSAPLKAKLASPNDPRDELSHGSALLHAVFPFTFEEIWRSRSVVGRPTPL
jgi:hypothetical protein